MNLNYTSSPVLQLNVAANDLANTVTVKLVSSSAATATRTFVIPALSSPQTYSFNFAGEAALADVDTITFDFDMATSGDFAVASVNAVPEPVSIATLAVGFVGLALRRRRR